VLLLFSMAVTVITQALTSMMNRRGRHLKSGLADLLQQLGMGDKIATDIAGGLLKHPMIADGRSLGTVIHRAEFIKLLLDFAGGLGAHQLGHDAQDALKTMLADGGITDPEQTLKNIRALGLQLEAANPEFPSHIRDGLAILHEASSDFVARVDFWFDQTIDRVSQRFTHSTHWITLSVSVAVVLTVQLDIVAVADRLFLDDQTRNAIVAEATRQYSQANVKTNVDPRPYYDLLNGAGLVTLPLDRDWLQRLMDPRKVPGMILAVLLISLGAPFWYDALKDLLRLRSAMSAKDDAQREQRQAARPDASVARNATVTSPSWLSGERGDLTAVG
jgi:hypothetical protein